MRLCPVTLSTVPNAAKIKYALSAYIVYFKVVLTKTLMLPYKPGQGKTHGSIHCLWRLELFCYHLLKTLRKKRFLVDTHGLERVASSSSVFKPALNRTKYLDTTATS